jgi:hypothetical protein
MIRFAFTLILLAITIAPAASQTPTPVSTPIPSPSETPVGPRLEAEPIGTGCDFFYDLDGVVQAQSLVSPFTIEPVSGAAIICGNCSPDVQFSGEDGAFTISVGNCSRAIGSVTKEGYASYDFDFGLGPFPTPVTIMLEPASASPTPTPVNTSSIEDADTNNDGVINRSDLLNTLKYWMQTYTP